VIGTADEDTPEEQCWEQTVFTPPWDILSNVGFSAKWTNSRWPTTHLADETTHSGPYIFRAMLSFQHAHT
jgi:hypothetical protein